MDNQNFESEVFNELPDVIKRSNFMNCTFNTKTKFDRCNLIDCIFNVECEFYLSNIIENKKEGE